MNIAANTGFLDLLFLIFLVLKLCGIVSFGWPIVFLPLIIQGIIVVIFILWFLWLAKRWNIK